ncbi:hypothetical protein D3C71_1352070 [compost metagenome]
MAPVDLYHDGDLRRLSGLRRGNARPVRQSFRFYRQAGGNASRPVGLGDWLAPLHIRAGCDRGSGRAGLHGDRCGALGWPLGCSCRRIQPGRQSRRCRRHHCRRPGDRHDGCGIGGRSTYRIRALADAVKLRGADDRASCYDLCDMAPAELYRQARDRSLAPGKTVDTGWHAVDLPHRHGRSHYVLCAGGHDAFPRRAGGQGCDRLVECAGEWRHDRRFRSGNIPRHHGGPENVLCLGPAPFCDPVLRLSCIACACLAGTVAGALHPVAARGRRSL